MNRKRLCKEELNELYYSSNIIRMIKSRRIRWAEHVARIEEVLVGKPEGKRPLGTPRRRLVDNIKMYFIAMKWRGMDWIDVAEDRHRQRALVNAVMNRRVP